MEPSRSFPVKFTDLDWTHLSNKVLTNAESNGKITGQARPY